MDGGGTRTFVVRISIRSLMLGVVGCALLLLPAIWTVRQSRLAQEALARAIAAEGAATRAQAEAEQARAQVQDQRQPAKDEAVARASRHRDPKEAERVRELYKELDSLTRAQERIGLELQALRGRTNSKAMPGRTGEP